MLDKPLRDARDEFEKAYFEFHLAKEGGSMTRVAEKTGLERTHLYRKLKQLGVDLTRGKRSAEFEPRCGKTALRLIYNLRSGPVAQSVEQRIENPCVGGSIPPQATSIQGQPFSVAFSFSAAPKPRGVRDLSACAGQSAASSPFLAESRCFDSFLFCFKKQGRTMSMLAHAERHWTMTLTRALGRVV